MKINEKEYKLELTGYTLVVYKQEFHKDLFAELINFEKEIDVVAVMQIIWAFVKSSNNDIPDFIEFAKSITNVSSLITKESISELTNAINTKRNVEPKKA